MKFKAILIPQHGEKADQVFCEDLEQAKKWARKILWDRHRKLVQSNGNNELTGPRVAIMEFKPVNVHTVYPWDVTDADKLMEPVD